MALHSKHSIRHRLNDEVYASADLSRAMPKYRFPEPERDPRAVYAAVHDELMLDGNARQNLATFCQTWEEPELHRLMDECIAKNIVDKDEYPQTAEDRGALRPYAGRSLEFTASRRHNRLFHDWLQRGGHAEWFGHEAAVGSETESCGTADWQTEPDHRAGPDLLAQIHALLGYRASRDPHGTGTAAHDGRKRSSNAAMKTPSAWRQRWA